MGRILGHTKQTEFSHIWTRRFPSRTPLSVSTLLPPLGTRAQIRIQSEPFPESCYSTIYRTSLRTRNVSWRHYHPAVQFTTFVLPVLSVSAIMALMSTMKSNLLLRKKNFHCGFQHTTSTTPTKARRLPDRRHSHPQFWPSNTGDGCQFLLCSCTRFTLGELYCLSMQTTALIGSDVWVKSAWHAIRMLMLWKHQQFRQSTVFIDISRSRCMVCNEIVRPCSISRSCLGEDVFRSWTPYCKGLATSATLGCAWKHWAKFPRPWRKGFAALAWTPYSMDEYRRIEESRSPQTQWWPPPCYFLVSTLEWTECKYLNRLHWNLIESNASFAQSKQNSERRSYFDFASMRLEGVVWSNQTMSFGWSSATLDPVDWFITSAWFKLLCRFMSSRLRTDQGSEESCWPSRCENLHACWSIWNGIGRHDVCWSRCGIILKFLNGLWIISSAWNWD